jgi:serine protease Do
VGVDGEQAPVDVEHGAARRAAGEGSRVLDAPGDAPAARSPERLGHRADQAEADARAGWPAGQREHRGAAAHRRRFGVALAPAEVARRLRRSVGLPDATGLLVREVMAGSPAEAAGLREGDLLTAAGGRELATTDDLHEALDAVAEGEALVVSVLRGNEPLSATVRFDAPAAEAATGEAAEPSEPA